ncbi:MAG: beta-ketoacyl-[acyl-carrier-protein] synthase II [Candidatus Fluviicola riflensis]|nr:MAG: beta-ketoacyl-[acyl-carrier-protein] synthase II [Candidatus Fluviicola riflensis]OGS76611.1 MAG: beta-ketoacyl-[acyl-carrier-protein] synthase II [Candidatus Fluviicola riflensis]OGS83034.1 MAG: beta-ketoacyl-[acyl-carrier-protein] synthase II [Fluviicola sp. RIFCSPHIGHO2_01_FULL_43_53]OGS88342.1 MAG: beta-ketoacyl-[acyl-carrier-protein] synthase II [Fluviicola sp. RIFCSPHIGHO2_12_FULL_43_24]
MTRRVVVTGIGALSPIGNDVETFWSNMVAGKSGAAAITKFDTSKFKTTFACELKGFDPKAHFDVKEIRKYDPFSQYALVAVDQAVKDGNIDFEQLNKDRIGVIWGSGNGGIQTFQDQMIEYCEGDGTPRFTPFFIPRILVDIASGIISIKYGLRGVNFCPVSACATSNTAIIEAFNYIKWGKANMVITGGSEAAITQSAIGGFSSAQALSKRNEEPEKASRPFDTDRDGFVMGEGAGALILEELEHAQARGAKIYGEIVGGGHAADAYHLTGTHPEGDGAVLGMEEAMREAGITANDIDYINMHATSTSQGDMSELIAAKRVFGERKSLSISGTKSMTGHLLGAAGAIEAIACIKALETGIVPPTINTENIEPEFADLFDFPLGKGVKKDLTYAMSNTFGFGGHIASVVMKKWSE